jgi:hypothetical protein
MTTAWEKLQSEHPAIATNDSSKVQIGGDHYKSLAIQPSHFIFVNKIPYHEANVIKYVCRHEKKHGKIDLLKAKHYIDLLIEEMYPDDAI